MRAFVAIDVPSQVLDSLAGFQSELARTGADLKLVERENLHFTLKFLGEITEAQAEEARARLGRLRLPPFRVDVSRAGAFPSLRRARVVWAGVPPEHEAVMLPLAREVIEALQGIGERDERPFQPHITLARVRTSRNIRELGDFLQKSSERPFGTADLTEFKLKSSTLTPGGPVYKDIGAFPLT